MARRGRRGTRSGGRALAIIVVVVGVLGMALFVGGVVVARDSARTDLGADQTSTEAPTTETTAPPTTAATTTSTTLAPTTTTTEAPPAPPAGQDGTADPEPSSPDGTLGPGDDGPEVAALQQRLLDLGFWLPAVDGGYGTSTRQAVMAFQKANGLGRDGIAGPVTQAALAGATRPEPGSAEGDHVEIDLDRQIVLLVRGGAVEWVLNTSTGTGGTPTPPGDFVVQREIDGWRHAPLGDLYRPKYFNGGIAIHGAFSIPGSPASHGCARLSNAAMDLIWDDGYAPIGTRVWVY